MKALRLAKTLGLTTALLLGVGFSAKASVTMAFTWDQTFYQAGYTATYINSSDAIGIYHFNVSSGLNSQDLWSVCLSPAGLLNGGTYTYNVLPFNAANPGIYPSAWAWNGSVSKPQYWGVNNAAYLWNRYGSAILNNTGLYAGNQSSAAAALEFAIWTALYDSTSYGVIGNNNWAAPTGQMNQQTLNYYNSFINGLISSGITGPQFTGNILEGQGAVSGGPNSGQSQEFFLLGTPVPEPTTLVAGALLLLPFGASTLRMLRRNRTA